MIFIQHVPPRSHQASGEQRTSGGDGHGLGGGGLSFAVSCLRGERESYLVRLRGMEATDAHNSFHAGWGYDHGLPVSGALARESSSVAVDMVLATAVEAVRVQLAEHERQLDVHTRLQSDLKVLDSVRKRLEEDVEGKVGTAVHVILV